MSSYLGLGDPSLWEETFRVSTDQILGFDEAQMMRYQIEVDSRYSKITSLEEMGNKEEMIDYDREPLEGSLHS